jgi:hypothetical protein
MHFGIVLESYSTHLSTQYEMQVNLSEERVNNDMHLRHVRLDNESPIAQFGILKSHLVLCSNWINPSLHFEHFKIWEVDIARN